MLNAQLFGLIWICIGLAQLAAGRALESVAAKGYARSHPEQDVEKYMRRKRRQYWVTATLAIVIGGALLAYGMAVERINEG